MLFHILKNQLLLKTVEEKHNNEYKFSYNITVILKHQT